MRNRLKLLGLLLLIIIASFYSVLAGSVKFSVTYKLGPVTVTEKGHMTASSLKEGTSLIGKDLIFTRFITSHSPGVLKLRSNVKNAKYSHISSLEFLGDYKLLSLTSISSDLLSNFLILKGRGELFEIKKELSKLHEAERGELLMATVNGEVDIKVLSLVDHSVDIVTKGELIL